MLLVVAVDVERGAEGFVGVACVVHCQLSVEVECGDLTAVLVVHLHHLHSDPAYLQPSGQLTKELTALKSCGRLQNLISQTHLSQYLEKL